MNKKIVIIGGGIAGLSTATLLCEQGFAVTLLEASDAVGGLAKSGREQQGFPIEHSLRVYHETYDCLFSLFKKIPYGETGTTLYEQLVPISFALTHHGKSYIYHSKNTHFIKSRWGLLKLLWFFYQQGFKAKDFLQLLKEECLIRLSYERLFSKIKDLSIAELLTNVSPKYLNIIYGMHQTAFVATKESSALLAIKFDTEGKPFSFFAMANGPTSERILDPWVQYLAAKGVVIRKKTRVINFILHENTLQQVELESGELVTADIFVCAVSNISFTHFATVSRLKEVAGLQEIAINSEWSNGIQLYLTDLPKTITSQLNYFQPGTLQTYLDSPWKLASVVQGEGMWHQVALPKNCRFVLSITSTVANVNGTLHQKPFLECTKQEILEEILHQCHFSEKHLIIDWHLDDAIRWMTAAEYQLKKTELAPHKAYARKDGQWLLNFSPLNVPTSQAFKTSPPTRTALNNLYLAGDFCKAAMFVPTMEKACETGYLAAQAITEDLKLESTTVIKLPFKSYNHKNHVFFRNLDAFLFKLQTKIVCFIKRKLNDYYNSLLEFEEK